MTNPEPTRTDDVTGRALVTVPVGVNTVEVKSDAVNRAVRTLIQNLLVDAGTGLGAVILLQINDVHWTKAWWLAFAGLLGKTVVVSGISYVGRFLVKPKGAVNG